jgi:hypothetical protein
MWHMALALLARGAGAQLSDADIDQLRAQLLWPSGTEAVGGVTDPTQDCAVAALAYEYGNQLQPERAPNRALFDALRLGTVCGQTPPPFSPDAPPHFPLPAAGASNVFYVDPETGSDSASGAVDKPLRTVAAAVGRLRSVGAGGTAVLRAGVHFLNATLEIPSGTVLQNFPGERAFVSGGVPISAVWEAAPGFPAAANVWRTQLPTDLADVPGLNRLGGPTAAAKMTRARFPNRDTTSGTMETALLNGGAPGATWLKPPEWGTPAYPASKLSRSVVVDAPPEGNITTDHLIFTYGVGGDMCARYSPPGGFWCSANSSGGGSGWELMVPGAPLFPVGLEVVDTKWSKDHDNPPPEPRTWRRKAGAVIETWTNGWSTTFWNVTDIVSTAANTSTFVFGGSGGQQTGRGFHIENPTTPPPQTPLDTEGGWKIENAIELLDVAEEFYFDPDTHTLYLAYNGTGTPPADGWVVPTLKQLLRVVGTQQQPVTDVSLLGLSFRDAAYTYLDEWGIPSGGDWALHRGGAVFLEGVERVTVDQSEFSLLDGNALFLSGYTRGVVVANSTFTYIGDNAVAAWGYTAELPGQDHGLPAGTGIDGTNGNQPRATKMVRNLVAEIGLNERQSSAFSEAKACLSEVTDNVFYNMPRAAINKNDGFGGSTVVARNLIFNTCRESSDHGNFNRSVITLWGKAGSDSMPYNDGGRCQAHCLPAGVTD